MSEVVAVVYVVDSSITLASEWGQLLQEYTLPMLQRLGESYQGKCAFRIGLVSYAMAETRPKPLLEKVFFGTAVGLLKELREDPAKFGIGTTGAGGSRGMAALEGLVAAVELFDALRESMEVAAAHIFHIAAAPPDSAERPMWNMSPVLDEVTWETLPSEMRKRNISYSNVLLKSIPRFSELYTSAAAGTAQNPWFPVRAQHTLRLSGFPTSSQKGVKRQVEGTSTSDQSPESKRTRVQSNTSQSSPKVANTPTQAPANTAPPAPASSSNPQAAPAKPTFTLQQIEERLRALQAAAKQKAALAKAHQTAGRHQEAVTANNEAQSLMKACKQCMAMLYQKSRMGSGPLSQSQSQPINVDAADGATGSVSADGKDGPGMSASASAPQVAPPPSQSAAVIDLTLPDPPSPVEPAQPAPTVQSQPAAVPDLPVQPQIATDRNQNLTPSQPPAQHVVQNQASTMPGTSNQQPSTSPEFGSPIWEGTLSWGGGLDTLGRMLQAQAAIYTPQQAHGEILRTMKWPSDIVLVPSQDHAAPIFILQDWLRRYQNQCAIIYLMAKTQGADAPQNDENLGALSRSLQEKNVYGIAAFTGATGIPERRILIFPAKNNRFAGAFFMTPKGMPDPPKSEIAGLTLSQLPPPLALLLGIMTPQQHATLAEMSLDRRLAALKSLFSRQQQHIKSQQPQQPQQSQQPQQPPPSHAASPVQQQPQQPRPAMTHPVMNPFVNGQPPPLSKALMSAVGEPQHQTAIPNFLPGVDPNAMGSQGASTMMHRRTPSTGSANGMSGISNSVSLEMMQSFMQRN